MVWVADPHDIILAEITSHLNFNNNDWLFGVTAKRVMRAQWERDFDRLARVQSV